MFYKGDIQNTVITVWSLPCRAPGDWRVAETRVSHPPRSSHAGGKDTQCRNRLLT